MPSRIELEQRARVIGISPSTYPNDSKLEQRILYLEKNMATVTGTLATGTLTSTGTAPSNGDEVLIGVMRVYSFVTTLTETAATFTVTDGNSTNFINGDIITIGTVTYTFVTTLGAAQNQIAISTTADLTLANLVLALNGSGSAGTNYSTGTVDNPNVIAASVSSHATVLSWTTVGSFANSVTVNTTAASVTLSGTNFTGGVDPVANQILIGGSASASLTNLKSALNGTTGSGTTYSSGTVPSLHVTAGTLTSTTLVVTANTQSTGQTINSTAPVGSTFSWGATTLQSNVQPIIVAPTDSVNGQEGAAAV